MDVDEEIVTLVERFLVRYICKDENINTFDYLRNMVYYKKSKTLVLERFPPTSSIVFLRMKRAYLQSYVWLRSPFAKSLVIDPLEYGYKLQEDEDDKVMKPNIMTEDPPVLCKCEKCARANTCICRASNVVSIATAKLKHAKILRTNTFYIEILC